jgi:hypothetical protein
MTERIFDREWREAAELVRNGQLDAATALISRTFGWLADCRTPEIRAEALVTIVLEAMLRQHQHDRGLPELKD